MTIINNKYRQIYYNIINNSKKRIVNCYTELHHILPRSLGGSNNIDNIAVLTAREHYICHYLLCKFTKGKSKYKMLHAFHFMNISNPRGNGLRYTNSCLYKKLKQERSIKLSTTLKGHICSESTRGKLSIKAKERFKYQPGTFTGKKHTLTSKKIISFKRKLSANNNPFKHTEHTKAKLSISRLGKLNPAARAVMINKVKYDTILEAAQFLNIHKDTCRWRIANPAPKWTDWLFL